MIAFNDGSYIELFSWKGVPPNDHPWGIRDPGLLDFALSTASTATSNWDRLVRGFEMEKGDGQLGIIYGKPKPGGRKTPAGVNIEWETTHPEYSEDAKTPASSHLSKGRIEAPFWCHDKTERKWRTPYDDVEKTTHPSGATSIAQVEILVPKFRVSEYARLYETVTGSSAEEVNKESGLTNGSGYTLSTITPISEKLNQQIWIRPTEDLDDGSSPKVGGIGINGLILKVEGKSGDSVKWLSESGTGAKIGIFL